MCTCGGWTRTRAGEVQPRTGSHDGSNQVLEDGSQMGARTWAGGVQQGTGRLDWKPGTRKHRVLVFAWLLHPWNPARRYPSVCPCVTVGFTNACRRRERRSLCCCPQRRQTLRENGSQRPLCGTPIFNFMGVPSGVHYHVNTDPNCGNGVLSSSTALRFHRTESQAEPGMGPGQCGGGVGFLPYS